MSDVVKFDSKRWHDTGTDWIVLGLIGAFVLTRLMSSLLFAVRPTDLATFVIVSLCLFSDGSCCLLSAGA